MEDLTSKTIAVFSQPFNVPGFDESLPAGEYEIETELVAPPDHENPEAWKASALLRLHPRISHPGLARTLTVSLADLDHARANDKLTGKALTDFFLEEMLADPMIRLVMQADGVAEADLRDLYSPGFDRRQAEQYVQSETDRPIRGMDDGESGPRYGSARPGIGE